MNIRDLNYDEAQNLELIKDSQAQFALLYITENGLKKSILDATQPIRTLLEKSNIHRFDNQGQGQDHKEIIESVFFSDHKKISIKTSLYRPNTKNGDPRIWFSGLSKKASGDDIFCLFVHESVLYLINLTRSKAAENKKEGRDSELNDLLNSIKGVNKGAAERLLGKLREIASAGPHKAVCSGDTSIGRTLESLLGIEMNSRKTPDFEGIEIKTSRYKGYGGGKHTLFAQVPLWKISTFKSSTEILDVFGYYKNHQGETGPWRLNTTMTIMHENAQGMRLKVNKECQTLESYSNDHGHISSWELSKLHDRFIAKHNETFWIKAESEKSSGFEYFNFKEVTHTSRPSLPQFDKFLEAGIVTVDHVCKSVTGKKGGAGKERGPLFRSITKRVPELFISDPIVYDLVDAN